MNDIDFDCDGDNFAYAYGRSIHQGKYSAFVEQAKVGLSKSSGKPMLTLTMAIDGDDKTCPEGGVRIDVYIPVGNSRAVNEFVYALVPSRAEEWEQSSRKKLPSVNADDLIGLECEVAVYHEEYNGRDQAKARLLGAPDA